MSEQKKKKKKKKTRRRIYDLLNAETKPKYFCLPNTKQTFFFLKKNFLRKGGAVRGLNKKQSEGFLTALAWAIKKYPATSIRKHANELSVDEKTAIKRDFSPDLNLLDYAMWVILGNKTNQLSILQILVCIRLLLRRNGIKCMKNLF